MIARRMLKSGLLTLVASAGFATTALGQNALGDGRGLESRLQTPRPPQANPMRAFSQELLFRESIVSGTAPLGLSFRGETLPGRFEFRGDLGEDDLFAFRRDSLYSGLAGRGIRGTDALQYQFALTTGSSVPQTLAGGLTYARAGAAERGVNPEFPTIRDVTADAGPQRVSPEDYMDSLELSSSLVQPVRSLSTYATDRGMQPNLVGIVQDRTTSRQFGQTASPLTGVQNVPVDALRGSGMRQPMPSDTRATPSALPTTPQTPPAATGTGAGQPPVRTAYDDLIARYREQAGVVSPDAGNEGMPAWARDLTSVRNTLRGLPDTTAKAIGLEPDPDREPIKDAAGRLEERSISGEMAEAAAPLGFNTEGLRRIREAGGMAVSLVPDDVPIADRYASYMKSGQDMLARERFFDAEERFISALSARPGDVNAAVGRAHAQLGAGLYLSAAVNLRQLFFGHPEIVGMRYGANLLPEDSRREQLAASFRQSLDSPASGADSGLLLAYLGYQAGDTAMTVEGLDALEEWGVDADKRLAEMLRAVWTETTPTEAPESGG